MADYTPVYTPGQTITLTASAAITGGTIVEVTGSGTVGPAGATSVKHVGVAAFDAASGARVTIHAGKQVHEVTASGTVTAGDLLSAAAAGQVATNASPATGTVVGLALTSASSGAKVQFLAR